MTECTEHLLRAGGRMMSCLEKFSDHSSYGRRESGSNLNGMPARYDSGMRYGRREDPSYPTSNYYDTGMRRGSDGRYM